MARPLRVLRRRMCRAINTTALMPMTTTLSVAILTPSTWISEVKTGGTLLDAVPKFHPYSAMLKYASVAILVCGDLSREKFKGFWVQDCSAATQNILLAATARGLGAVWTALHPLEDRVAGMRKLLGLPEHIIPLALVPIGYPDEHPGQADRFDAARVHKDRW